VGSRDTSKKILIWKDPYSLAIPLMIVVINIAADDCDLLRCHSQHTIRRRLLVLLYNVGSPPTFLTGTGNEEGTIMAPSYG
jgi:hypothetical protein